MTTDAFGLKAAGKILGSITVLDALGGGLGPWVSGVLYDRRGSYNLSFLTVSGLILLSLLGASTIQVRPPEPAPAGG